MSYDLYFWRQTNDLARTPQDVLEALSDGEPVEGIEAFPKLLVIRVLKQAFPEISEDRFELNWEGAGSYFQVHFNYIDEETINLITVTCGYTLLESPDVVNRLINSCASLGCALFDPPDRQAIRTARPKILSHYRSKSLVMQIFHTMQEAETAIRNRMAAEGNRGNLEYEFAKVIETDKWWYIPYRWIGGAGFVVNKCDLYVNWLGSGIPLEKCFWGHDRGVYCDLVDFVFAPETDVAVVAKLIPRFQHMHPNPSGVLPLEPVWYRESEVSGAIARQFPRFKRHFVWQAIPELFHAWEHEGLRFICSLSTGGFDRVKYA